MYAGEGTRAISQESAERLAHEGSNVTSYRRYWTPANDRPRVTEVGQVRGPNAGLVDRRAADAARDVRASFRMHTVARRARARDAPVPAASNASDALDGWVYPGLRCVARPQPSFVTTLTWRRPQPFFLSRRLGLVAAGNDFTGAAWGAPLLLGRRAAPASL